MKPYYKIFLCAFLLPLFASAQSNFKPGYIVKSKGDTVRGFVDYKGWESNPVAISFKPSLNNDKAIKYTLNDIIAFAVTGNARYEKFTINISTDETTLSRLGSTRDTTYKTGTVFLNVLQKEKNVALYSYTDDIKTRFYIGEAPDYIPAELVYRAYNNLDAGSGSRLKEENAYKRQLFLLLNKYNVTDENAAKNIETAQYNSDDLLLIVSEINNLSKADFNKQYVKKNKIRLYAGVAYNSSNTVPNPNSSFVNQGGKGSTSQGPSFSIGTDLFSSPNTGWLQFRLELGVTPAKYKALYLNETSPTIPYRASFDDVAIYLTPHAILNFYNAENFKIYGGLGFIMNYYKYSNIYYGPQDTSIDAAFEDYRLANFIFDFLLKAGIQINKKWEVYFNYIPPTLLTNNGYYVLKQDRKQIGISYFFR